MATIVGAGALQRIELFRTQWADVSILSTLREVQVFGCDAVEDLSPLADVPKLVVSMCDSIKALPAMRNDVLVVLRCDALTDLSGLAGGRVGASSCGDMCSVKDVGTLGAMRPPLRTVILVGIDKVQDVSMLAGMHMLKVSNCPRLDKTATLAALEGKVGAILWEKDP